MATPPTYVTDYEKSYGDGTSPGTVSVTVAAGDVLVIAGGTEDRSFTLSTPTGGGLSYTLQQSVLVNNYCTAYAWTTSAGSGQTYTQSVTRSGTGGWFGYNAVRFSGSGGVGNSAKTNAASGAPSLDITTSQDNSAIVVVVTDWTATDGTSRTWRTVNGATPSAGNGQELTYFRNSTHYAAYVAYYPDAGAAGVKTVGLSAPAGQKYSIIAVEVLGTAGATTHDATASGASTTTGSAVVTLLLAATVSGASTSAGSAAATIVAGSTTHAATASGGSTSAGTAAAGLLLAALASGASTSAGSAAATVESGPVTHTATASGASTSSGSAAVSLRLGATGAGASTSTGTASASLLSGPQTHTATATGAATSDGSATARLTITITASGAATSAGSATPGMLLAALASAASTSAGSALARIVGESVPATSTPTVAGGTSIPAVTAAVSTPTLTARRTSRPEVTRG